MMEWNIRCLSFCSMCGHFPHRVISTAIILVLFLLLPLAPSVRASAPIAPNHDSARANAYRIFNAVNSAGRQFGSSLYHNGLGFFPASIPRGTLLYHGSRKRIPPEGEPQWLAFEMEHAQTFSVSKRQKKGGKAPVEGVRGNSGVDAGGGDDAQKPIGTDPTGHRQEEEWNSRGYLQTYRTLRDLRVLYVDGMSAAKSKMGPLDSQDLILRENRTGSWDDYMDEGGRARDICELIGPWGYDSIVRMEIGFEVVHCDFSNGLELVEVARSPMPEQFVGKDDLYLFQLARAVSEQFDNLGKDRLRIDFSSMVSALFFPIALPKVERLERIRLDEVPLEDLGAMKSHLESVATAPRRYTVNWQAVTDTVVSRFAERVSFMASPQTSNDEYLTEVQKAVMTYYDAPPLPDDLDAGPEDNLTSSSIPLPGADSVLVGQLDDRDDRIAAAQTSCKRHHLLGAALSRREWSLEDELIHAALETVTGRICRDLFQANEHIQQWRVSLGPEPRSDAEEAAAAAALQQAISRGRALLAELIAALQWPRFQETRRCPVGQVWFVSMYPYGTDEDHVSPGCRDVKEMEFPRIGYWDLDYFTDKEAP